ncbi:DUF6455 family protein [Sediminimonas sp.]|uniref:DUF6455 family protein n=1 Tax=Sediminimonas sp. TaxID=2823379 RepID=UPI0025D866CD|nr:DUF6455 family protein [Sediminimonas sp.]
MNLLERIGRRARVMGRMARTLDVNFADRIARDEGEVARYRGAVMRCAFCRHEAACQDWMDGQEHAAQAPKYCRNKDLLDSLSPN